jgi:hypothetical protein
MIVIRVNMHRPYLGLLHLRIFSARVYVVSVGLDVIDGDQPLSQVRVEADGHRHVGVGVRILWVALAVKLWIIDLVDGLLEIAGEVNALPSAAM